MTKRLTVFTRSEGKVKIPIGFRALIKRSIKNALEYEGFEYGAELSVTVTDNEGIHQLNLAHRNIDRPTDVLSFPLYEGDFDDGSEIKALGDIVISLERAREQAKEYGHSLKREVAFLTVHSVLHLLGYDHERSEQDEKEMFYKQEEILKRMGIQR